MNAELQQDSSESHNATESGERLSPGALIRRARERARLAPEELAAQTKLARNVLDALERDDFNTLNEPVYVRGYYRKCAKVLEIPERDLINAYETTVAPRAPALPAKLRLASGTDLGNNNRLPVSFAAMFAVGAVILCALIWFARGEPSNAVPPTVSAKADAMTPENAPHASVPPPAEESVTPAATELTPAASAPVAMTPAPTQTTALTPVPVAMTPAAPAASAPAPSITPTPAVTPAIAAVAAAPTATPAPGAITLSLTFTITSWARVDDASGKTLLNGLMRSGEKQNLSGAAPFTVFLGNAPGVKAAVNGKNVELAKYTAANNTARFTLSGN